MMYYVQGAGVPCGVRGLRRCSHPVSVCSPQLKHGKAVLPSTITRTRASSDSSDEVFREKTFKEFPLASRGAVLRAVEELGYSSTAAEVASQAALPIAEAEQCLQALAIDASGSLKVTEAGDIIYTFPQNLGLKLQQQELYLQGEAAAKALEKVTRISFGVVLVASILFSVVAISVILTAASSSSDNNSSRGGGFSFGDDRGGGGGGGGMWLWIDPWPVMTGDTRRSRRLEQGQEKVNPVAAFFEDAFAVVFGGSNPNEGFDEKRWRAVGERIAMSGGVVAAEQILPLLDVSQEEDLKDEAYMLPVMLRFNGTADVATLPDGQPAILYRFPDLQRRTSLSKLAAVPSALAGGAVSGVRKAITKAASWVQDVWSGEEESEQLQNQKFVSYAGKQPFAEQKQWTLFDVRPGNVPILVGVVGVNVLLLSYLGALLSDPSMLRVLQESVGQGFVSVVSAVTPVLYVYASLYFLGPLFRFIQNLARNARIEQANRLRSQAAYVRLGSCIVYKPHR